MKWYVKRRLEMGFFRPINKQFEGTMSLRLPGQPTTEMKQTRLEQPIGRISEGRRTGGYPIKRKTGGIR